MWLLLIAVGTGYLARCWQSSRKSKPTVLECDQSPRQQSKGKTFHGSQPKISTSTDKRLIYSEVKETSGSSLNSRDVYIDGQNGETEEGGGVGVEEVDNSSMAIDRKRKKEYGSQPFDQVSLVKLLSKECVGSHRVVCISANGNLKEEGGSTLINEQLSEDCAGKSSKTQGPISDFDGTNSDDCPFIQRAKLISTFSESSSVLEPQLDSDCGREESCNHKSRISTHLYGKLLKIGNEDGSASEHRCSNIVTDIEESLFEPQSHQMLCISANRNLREEGRSPLRNNQTSEDCAEKSGKTQEPISDFDGTSSDGHLVIHRANLMSTFLEKSSVTEPQLDSDCSREEGRNQKSRRLTHLFGNHLKIDNKDGSISEHRGSKLVTDIAESSQTSSTTKELNSHLDGSYSGLGLSPDAFVSGFLESSRCHHENDKEKKKMRGKASKRKDSLKLQRKRRRPFHRKTHLSSWVSRNEFFLGSCLKAYVLDGNANGGKTCFSRWFWLQACMGSDYGGFSALEGVRIADSKGNLRDAERRIDDNCTEKKALPQTPHFQERFSDISLVNQGTFEVKKSSNDFSVASSSLQPSGFGYNMIGDSHVDNIFTPRHLMRTTAGVHLPIAPNAAEVGSASGGGLLFHFGVGIGAILMMATSRDEMKKLCESMKETKELVNDLRRKFDSSKLERLQMLRLNDNVPHEESHFCFSQLKDCQAKLEIPISNGVHMVRGFDGEDNNSSKSVLTEEEVARGNNNNMSKLEAELEAELQRMEFSLDRRRHDNQLHISSFDKVGNDYWAAPSEYEESSDSECTGGPLNSYAVSAVELERRLWRIIEQRHEELENTLETTEQKLTAKEEELHGWKERVRYLTNVSVGYSTGDESLSDEVSSQISCEELLMSGFEDSFLEKESSTELWEIQGGCL